MGPIDASARTARRRQPRSRRPPDRATALAAGSGGGAMHSGRGRCSGSPILDALGLVGICARTHIRRAASPADRPKDRSCRHPLCGSRGAAEGGLYATGLTEEVLTQLATFKELSVLGRETSRSISTGSDRVRLRQLGVDYDRGRHPVEMGAGCGSRPVSSRSERRPCCGLRPMTRTCM